MLIECKNCGAPLDVQPNKWLTTCSYCRATQRIKKDVNVYATPPDWRAPTQWTPPPHRAVRSATFTYNPGGAARKTGVMIAVLTLVPIIIPLLAVAGPLLGPLVAGWRWDGSETFVCDGNSERTISGKKVKAKAKPAIIVRSNCKLTIEDSNLSGERLFDIRENGRVTIRNSKVTMKSRKGFAVSGNFGVHVIGGKVIIRPPEGDDGTVTALATDGNADVELEGTTLEISVGSKGDTLIVGTSKSNGDIILNDVELVIVTDPKPGVVELFRMSSNGSGTMEGGSVDADGMKLELTGRRPATVEGVDLLNGSRIVQGSD